MRRPASRFVRGLLLGTLAIPLTAGTASANRTATIADLTLVAKKYSHSDQTSTGTMMLTVNDSTVGGDGWNVTVQSSGFVYSGAEGGTAIPAANFSLSLSHAPQAISGQAIDSTGTDSAPTGPQLGALAGVSGPLDVARTTLRAGIGYGQGAYTQALDVSLTIPGQSRAGTYRAAMTVTINAGP